MKDLNKLVTQWHTDRNTIQGSTVQTQLLKLVEEMCETMDAATDFARGGVYDTAEIFDGVGDCLVVINCLCNQLDVSVDSVIVADRYVLHTHEDSSLCSAQGRLVSLVLRKRSADVLMDALQEVVCQLANMLVTVAPDESVTESMLKAYEGAYNEIKDRKGRMIDGVFVKETDL